MIACVSLTADRTEPCMRWQAAATCYCNADCNCNFFVLYTLTCAYNVCEHSPYPIVILLVTLLYAGR